MNITKLISIAVALAIASAATGRLPQILHRVRLAQAHLIWESRATKWQKAFLFPIKEQMRRFN